MTDREAAWDAVHDALPSGWAVGPPTFDPAIRAWSVTARSTTRGRGKVPTTVTGEGVDEAAALRALDDRLCGVPQPSGSRTAEMERRIRLAYLQGRDEANSFPAAGRRVPYSGRPGERTCGTD
jgi:hypothetical protein